MISIGARADRSFESTLQIDQELLSACHHWTMSASRVRKLVAMGAPVDWQGENGCTPLRRARAEGYRGVATGLVNELVWSLCDLDNWIKTAAKKTKARAGGNKRQGVFNYNPLARGRHLLVEFLVNKAQREQVRARAERRPVFLSRPRGPRPWHAAYAHLRCDCAQIMRRTWCYDAADVIRAAA